MATKTCTIQYRQLKAGILGDTGDLKALLVDVLKRRHWDKNAKTRILDLDQDGSFVILNKVIDPDLWSGPFFAGQLIQLDSGTDVHAVTQSLEDDTQEFILENLNLGEQARVLRGAMYFAIIGNHVGLIEGQQVRGRTLERYLTALLQRAEELDPGQAVILNSKFLAGDGKELDESSELTVSAQPSGGRTAAAHSDSERVQVVDKEAGTEKPMGATVFDVLRVLGWDEAAISRLNADVPDDGWVEGFFRIFIKERRKKKPISRATINEALRNIDAADLGLKGNGQERGGIVKLSVQRQVETHRSLLDPQSAMEQIVNALREWSKSGKIDCPFG